MASPTWISLFLQSTHLELRLSQLGKPLESTASKNIGETPGGISENYGESPVENVGLTATMGGEPILPTRETSDMTIIDPFLEKYKTPIALRFVLTADSP